MVVLSSTWGQQSLVGRWPDLPARLLGELPVDEYQVVAALHPNVWSGHGAWQLRTWLARARDGGLLTIPPEGSWPAVLVAADCVIADHGSVGLYAAALDRPLVLALFGDEVVPGTALAALGVLAPRLEVGDALAEQIVAAIAGHRPGRYEQVASRAFAVAPVARSLRSVLYELLALPEPAGEPPLPGWPEPRPDGGPATSYAVYTRLSGGEIEVRRLPATVDVPAAPAVAGWWRHLAVYEQEWDLRMVQSASVVVRREPSDVEQAVSWAQGVLDRLPGVRLAAAAVAGGCVAVHREGRSVIVHSGLSDVMLQAACVWALQQTGELADVSVALRVGDRSIPVRLRSAEQGQPGTQPVHP